jgi:hypothetical protein
MAGECGNEVGGVTEWSVGPAYPFTVYAKGVPDDLRWHVKGPGLDTADYSTGVLRAKTAEDFAIARAKQYKREQSLRI